MSIKISLELDENEMSDQITIETLKNIVFNTKADLSTCWHVDDIKRRKKVTKAAKYILENWLMDDSEHEKFARDLEALGK